jgi:hypothetical protein
VQLAAPVTTHLALTSAFARKDSAVLALPAQVGIETKNNVNSLPTGNQTKDLQ